MGNNRKIDKYEDMIQNIYGNKKYGFQSNNWMIEGQNKVYNVVEKMKLDKDINVFDFLDYIDYLRENGVF